MLERGCWRWIKAISRGRKKNDEREKRLKDHACCNRGFNPKIFTTEIQKGKNKEKKKVAMMTVPNAGAGGGCQWSESQSREANLLSCD